MLSLFPDQVNVMRKYSRQIVMLAGLMMLGLVALAQPGNGNGPRRPPGPPRPQIPIDGGISILAAAGVAYGARKLYIMRQKGQE